MNDLCADIGYNTIDHIGKELYGECMYAADEKENAAMLVDGCDELCSYQPEDYIPACVLKKRRRVPMNILFGPPANRDDCDRMMSLFFSETGKHIICGGTTSIIAANYLDKPIKTHLNYVSDLPPVAEIEGVDLVTEGVVTVSRVLEYAKDYLGENKFYEHWRGECDGASLISHMLFEEATNINFYVGCAVNPAHQHADPPINFSIKMNLIEELSKCLKSMGKHIEISYF